MYVLDKYCSLVTARWHIRDLAHSRELARLQAHSAILAPDDRLLTLDPLLSSNAMAKYFAAVTFNQKQITPQIDYKALKVLADAYQPGVIFSSAVSPISSQLIDYNALYDIASNTSTETHLITDISEIAGLLATNIVPKASSPFLHAKIVITNTRGSLRGPPGALIYFRCHVPVKRVDSKTHSASTLVSTSRPSSRTKSKPTMWDLESAINYSVFPGHQGGPHNHAITAVAVALGQVLTPGFKEYQGLVLENTRAMAEKLSSDGLRCGLRGAEGAYTDRAGVGIDEKSNIDVERVRKVLNVVGVVCGIGRATEGGSELRMGTLAMTTRGLRPDDFRRVGDLIRRAIIIAKEMADGNDERRLYESENILGLRRKAEDWMVTFPLL